MTRSTSRGPDPTCMSNSETTISVSICATHSWWDNNKPGVAKVQGQPWPTPGCHQKTTAQGLLPTTRQTLFYNRATSQDSPESLRAKILTHDSSTSQPSYTSRSERSSETAGPLPRLHGPRSTASTCQNIQRETPTVFRWSQQEAAQQNKHQMEWRSRVGRKKKALRSADSTKPLWGSGLKGRGGRGGRDKRGGIFPLVPEPCRDPAPKPALPISALPCWAAPAPTRTNFGANRLEGQGESV